MVFKWNVPEGTLSNKNQTLPEITPVQAIPSPPTALNAHSTPIPFIDKISVLFELPTEQDASSQNPSLSRQGRPRGYAFLFFPTFIASLVVNQRSSLDTLFHGQRRKDFIH
jgi:hypothetical protein